MRALRGASERRSGPAMVRGSGTCWDRRCTRPPQASNRGNQAFPDPPPSKNSGAPSHPRGRSGAVRCGQPDGRAIPPTPMWSLAHGARDADDADMQILAGNSQSRAPIGSPIVRSAFTAVLLLVVGLLIGWLCLATPLVTSFVPQGRPSVAETATGAIAWGFAIVVPAAFLIIGVARIAAIIDTTLADAPARSRRPASRRPSARSTSPRPGSSSPAAGASTSSCSGRSGSSSSRSSRRRTSRATSGAAGRSATTAAGGSRSRRPSTARPATRSASAAGWAARTATSWSASTRRS